METFHCSLKSPSFYATPCCGFLSHPANMIRNGGKNPGGGGVLQKFSTGMCLVENFFSHPVPEFFVKNIPYPGFSSQICTK